MRKRPGFVASLNEQPSKLQLCCASRAVNDHSLCKSECFILNLSVIDNMMGSMGSVNGTADERRASFSCGRRSSGSSVRRAHRLR
ncbi:hypothetical protein F441_18564 [Phytophthora nicotianae CJ01A1]|uniref:Uncharacterized protein n=4 Tax=Phytophthora nicotianae TaxID=4792 RepID=V9E7D0_PHYNI|nr:hypothetical protein F443_18705 [Phytophthora nicotianae P1569]ETK75166.1 hypothetical protein L915_18183 [Phytophthora nicotianae]ETO63640.1 hypothetical protein F444_18700 [Phytophthora nicotianae P1976]ETP04718.1 hypothetical protein F441_18564 [Phytophthora nicotianae CJ01A1]ETL28593.1 hypothetical protein L916_18086 [Phytophthora nicotianae]